MESSYWNDVATKVARDFWAFEELHPDVEVANRLLNRSSLLARFVLYLSTSSSALAQYEKNHDARISLLREFLKRETGHGI